MRVIARFLAFLIITSWQFPSTATADIITFDFAGTVSSVLNPFNVLPPSLVQPGDPVQASLRFDTATQDFYPEEDRGSFRNAGQLTMNINGLEFEYGAGVQIDILHGANGGEEMFSAMALGEPTTWPQSIPRFANPSILLYASESAPPFDFLSDAELPKTLDFSRADMRFGHVRATSETLQRMYQIQFDFVQVPEPSVATLIVAAGSLWIAVRRFRFT